LRLMLSRPLLLTFRRVFSRGSTRCMRLWMESLISGLMEESYLRLPKRSLT
jgi:hypothetical protein